MLLCVATCRVQGWILTSAPDSGRGFKAKVLNTFQDFPISLGSGGCFGKMSAALKAMDDELAHAIKGAVCDPHIGVKKSFSMALMCTTRRRIPASASTKGGPKKGGLIPFCGLVAT